MYVSFNTSRTTSILCTPGIIKQKFSQSSILRCIKSAVERVHTLKAHGVLKFKFEFQTLFGVLRSFFLFILLLLCFKF